MLRVTIDLLPYGKESAKKTLKVIDIANTMTHDDPWKFGNYKARFRDSVSSDGSNWFFKYIMNFPREHYDAVYLAYLVLRKYVHEKQEPIDSRAERDKTDSSGSGHTLLPGVSSGVGKYGKRDSSNAGNPKLIRERIRILKRQAVSIWESELQKNSIS